MMVPLIDQSTKTPLILCLDLILFMWYECMCIGFRSNAVYTVLLHIYIDRRVMVVNM